MQVLVSTCPGNNCLEGAAAERLEDYHGKPRHGIAQVTIIIVIIIIIIIIFVSNALIKIVMSPSSITTTITIIVIVGVGTGDGIDNGLSSVII